MNRDVRVTFFQVKNDEQKRMRIVHLAQQYYNKKIPFLIYLPHQKAAEYVDLLLWRSPIESFLPHVIKDEPCQDRIVLTCSKENPNDAQSVLNLRKEPIENRTSSFFMKIYELEDLASTHSHLLSQKRYRTYKEAGYSIVTL